MASSDFRIIIVGGGPSGLMAAHMFHAAGLDFVLLERRPNVAEEQGAGIAVFPQNIRVLRQLGIWERVKEAGFSINTTSHLTGTGSEYDSFKMNEWLTENHGVGWYFLDRPETLRTLYETLPDAAKRRCFSNKKVEDIHITEEGVIVRCADGTTETGSIVVGADGVRSRVRDIMRKLAPATSADAPKANVEPEFTSTYRGFFGFTNSLIPGAENGRQIELHQSGFSTQLFCGRDKVFYIVYQKLDSPITKTNRYDQRDIDELLAAVGKFPATEKSNIHDLYKDTVWCHMTDLEEGVVDRWSWKRLVLVGDANNKQTPNAGLGWNCGIQDLVVLTNGLRALQSSKEGYKIQPEDLKTVFDQYEDRLRDHTVAVVAAAAQRTRVHSWDSWFFWVFDRYYLPWTAGYKTLVREALGKVISAGWALDFIEEKEPPTGLVPWKH